MVFTVSGPIGADARLNWNERHEQAPITQSRRHDFGEGSKLLSIGRYNADVRHNGDRDNK